MSDNTEAAQTAALDAGVSYDFDVAIIGHGPTGVTAANLLGKLGIRTLVVERDKDIYSRARAVTVGDWTLRIFQDMGIDEKCKLDMDTVNNPIWKTYEGKTVFRMGTPQPELSQPVGQAIYQPLMEADLRSVGTHYDCLDIRYGHTFSTLFQDADGVTVELVDPAGAPYEARVKYLIGADGGQSPVRESVGIKLDGITRPRRWIVIDAEVLNWWTDCNTVTFWSHPDRPMVDIPLARGNHRWEVPLGTGEVDDDFATEEAVWGLLRPLGVDEKKIRIKGWAFYSHHLRQAQRWREGRVVVLGDAAHLMPPWAGQGMQSGIGDAANAAWKIAMIVRGKSDDSLLDTIECERRPRVEQVTQQSVRLGSIIEASNPIGVAVRDYLGPLFVKIPNIDKVLVNRPGFLAAPTLATSPGGVPILDCSRPPRIRPV